MADVRLLIATPVRGSELNATLVTTGYSESVRMLARMMPVGTLPATLTFGADNIRARNRVVAKVLRDAPAVTHVLWWDDDQWPEDLNIVQAMLDTGEDVVGAPYTNKKQPLHWVHQLLGDGRELDARRLLEVRAVGFGFTITTRACLERMWACSRKYTDLPNPHKCANMFGQLFDRLLPGPGTDPEEETLLSEDFSFCKRWRDLGGKIWVYGGPGNLIDHAGMHAWNAREMAGAEVR